MVSVDKKRSQTIILMRHAECIKNNDNIIGGSLFGELTTSGISSLKRLISSTPDLRSVKSIWFSPSEQCKQSAIILAEMLKLRASKNELLKPLDLGVLSGLSVEQSAVKYPAAHASMEKWRRGKIDILDLKVPDLGDPVLFYEQGELFFESLENAAKPAIVIGTRSVLIMLRNVWLQKAPGKGYMNYEFENCEILRLFD